MREKAEVFLRFCKLATPFVLALASIVTMLTAANMDTNLQDKADMYNEGLSLALDGCSPGAAEKFLEASSTSPENVNVDVRSKYNTGTLILNCVLAEEIEPKALLGARSLLMDALREAETPEDSGEIADRDVVEIRKQLEVVIKRLQEEELLEGSESGEGESEDGEDFGEGEEGGNDPFSDHDDDPPSPARPRGDF